MLKNLMEIASVVTANGISKSEILSEIGRKDTLLYQLLEGILEERWITDEAAALALYPTLSKNNDEAYRSLKRFAKRHLIQYLFQLSPPESDSSRYRAMHYKAIISLASANILMSSSAVGAAIDMFEQAFALAEEYEIWYIGIVAADSLESSYALAGFSERQERVALSAVQMRKNLAAEREGKKLFYEFAGIVNATSHYSPEIRKSVQRLVSRMKKLAEKSPTDALKKQSLRASMITAMMQHHYENAVEVALQGLDELTNSPSFQTATLHLEYNMQLSYCLLQLRRFDEAKKYSNRALQYAVPHTINWSAVQGNAVLLAFRMEEWQQAALYLQDLMLYSSTMKGHEFRKEKYLLYHGYFAYMVQSGLVKVLPQMQEVAAQFNVEHLLSHSPITTRDKQGANIARVILQVLLMLAQGNVSGVNSKAEALRQYRQTYLKDPEFSRSAAFLKLLHLLIENEYNVAEVLHKGEKYARQLLLSTQNNNGAMEGIEPILLDQLWEYIIQHIKKLQKEGIILPAPPRKKKYLSQL
jgi:tetratricopeptide (TPR) repeat protein